MKKIFCSILAIAVVFSLTACAKKNTNATLEIEGNPTTGYEWTAKAETDGVVNIGSEYKASSTSQQTVGAGGKYTFTLSGVKAGETKVTFEYARSWEDVAPIATKVYTVTVDKNLNVTTKLISETKAE